MRSKVVGLAGPIGSGKTSVAQGVASVLKCPLASFGAYVREVAAQNGQGDARGVLQGISEQLIDSLGPRGLTRNVLASINWDRKHSLVVDGIRHLDVVTALREEVTPLPFILVYLDVRPEIQRERLAARDNLSGREINSFELHSTERDVGTRVRALADAVMTTDGQIQDTVIKVLTLINSVE